MTTETTGKYPFETGIYRPPSEGGSYSLLIRITRNCPWNRCTFCSMYKEEKFKLRSPEEIKRDIDSIAKICHRLKSISRELGQGGQITRQVMLQMVDEEPPLGISHGFVMVANWLASGGETVFLQDGNSPIMKSEKLVEVLKYLRTTFPSIKRVTSYARSKTLAKKELDELIRIREAGLDRLHVGLETGDDELLEKTKKGVTSQEHIEAGQKAMKAGFQLSEYWMPGLGGKERWEQHAKNTAQVLNEINPDYARSRPFFPSPGTPLLEEYERGELQLLSPDECLAELKLMIEELTFSSRLCFDHAGNRWTGENGRNLFSLSYEGYKFPEKKDEVLRLVEQGLEVMGVADSRR
ncbi:MAG: radical SAM protein [Proteobacteria bacterium]|nr:radical SAM protein [Pseudomonadota bacterium]